MLNKISYILNRYQKIRLVILLFMIFVGSFVELIGVSAVLPLVSAVITPDIIRTDKKYRFLSDILGTQDIRTFILYMALILVGIYILKNVYITCMYDVTYRFTYNNQRRVAIRLMRCYMGQDYIFHTSQNVADLMRNITTDVNGFFIVVINVLQLITETAVCVVLTVFLMIQDITTTLLLIALLSVFLFIVMVVFKKRLKKMGEESRIAASDMSRYLIQAFGGIKEIKVANIEEFFVSKYDESYSRFAGIGQRQQLLNIVPRPIMETVCIGGLLLFMSARIYLGADIAKFIPTMSIFAVAAVRMLPSFNRISGYISQISFNLPSVDAVYKDLKGIEELEKQTADTKVEHKEIALEKAVRLMNVSFAYPSRPDRVIFNDVTLDIPVRQSIAFVGPSGAGKTTLADMILGVLKPDKGNIYADDKDIYEYSDGWHDIVGYIPQSIFLTDDTVRANVAFGIEPDRIDDKKVWKALEEAQLADFIREQPEGLDCNVGDKGVRLSGGQRQRIGIARALYREPEILVLDEATSALDNDTETAVMEAIDSLAGTKTMIIIAHRLSTIKNCDRVYEVRDGRVFDKTPEYV